MTIRKKRFDEVISGDSRPLNVTVYADSHMPFNQAIKLKIHNEEVLKFQFQEALTKYQHLANYAVPQWF